ncbi:MAG: hypothetical protein WC554_18690 [Clostridia bacterium]|jgi:hypothetical protein
MKKIIEETPDGTPYEAEHGRITVTVWTGYAEGHLFQGLPRVNFFSASSLFDFYGPNAQKYRKLLTDELNDAYARGWRDGAKNTANN